MINGIIEAVDSAGINQRVFTLPMEISKVASWHIGEMEQSGIRESRGIIMS